MADENLESTLKVLQEETGLLDKEFNRLISSFEKIGKTPTRASLDGLNKELGRFVDYTKKAAASEKSSVSASQAAFIAIDAMRKKDFEIQRRELQNRVAAARGANSQLGVLATRASQIQLAASEHLYNFTGIQSTGGRAGEIMAEVALAAMLIDKAMGGLLVSSQLVVPSIARAGGDLRNLEKAGWGAATNISLLDFRLGSATQSVLAMSSVSDRVEYLGVATRNYGSALSSGIEETVRSATLVAEMGRTMGMSADESVKRSTVMAASFRLSMDRVPDMFSAIAIRANQMQMPMEDLSDTIQMIGDSVYMSSQGMQVAFRDVDVLRTQFTARGAIGRELKDLVQGAVAAGQKVSPLMFMAAQQGGTRKNFGSEYLDVLKNHNDPIERLVSWSGALMKRGNINNAGSLAAAMGDLLPQNAQGARIAEVLVGLKGQLPKGKSLTDVLKGQGANESELAKMGVAIGEAQDPVGAILSAIAALPRAIALAMKAAVPGRSGLTGEQAFTQALQEAQREKSTLSASGHDHVLDLKVASGTHNRGVRDLRRKG
jgi:hypothetical protein